MRKSTTKSKNIELSQNRMEVRDMSNEKIRQALKDHGVRQWELAEALKIGESVFSRMLRHGLSENEETYLLSVIEAIAAGKTRDKIQNAGNRFIIEK